MEIAVGTVEGTGAALNVDIGFIPSWVEVLNIDGLAKLDWTADMGDAKGLKQVTAGTISLISTNGITASDDDDTFRGFTIGADTDVNVSEETIMYKAGR